MAANARVLILARDDRLASDLATGLDRLGWRSVTARGLQGALAALADLPVEAAVVDLTEAGAETPFLAQRLKEAAAPRRLPVLGLGDPDPVLESWGYELILSPPVHPAQAALRLEALVRASVAEDEFALRRETFAERGRSFESAEPEPGALRILTVGEPAPKFLALAHALSAGGAETVAAFTAYTAFDYLHERSFDAVVLWAGEAHAEALSIAGGMRRNTRLYHIPTVLYQREGTEVAYAEAFHRGLADVASAETPETETARRVISLARTYRRETAIRSALDRARSSGLMDAATGLFTRDLFASHLAKLAGAARTLGRPMSVAVLKLAERPEIAKMRAEGWLDRATPQIGSMIGRLVRAEDTAARLGPDLFALALPASSLGAAKAAAERIAAVIACTAFEAGEGRQPFTVEFEIGAAQLEAGENAARTLERAAAGLPARKAV